MTAVGVTMALCERAGDFNRRFCMCGLCHVRRTVVTFLGERVFFDGLRHLLWEMMHPPQNQSADHIHHKA